MSSYKSFPLIGFIKEKAGTPIEVSRLELLLVPAFGDQSTPALSGQSLTKIVFNLLS